MHTKCTIWTPRENRRVGGGEDIVTVADSMIIELVTLLISTSCDPMTALADPFEESKAGPEVNQAQAWHHRLNTPGASERHESCQETAQVTNRVRVGLVSSAVWAWRAGEPRDSQASKRSSIHFLRMPQPALLAPPCFD